MSLHSRNSDKVTAARGWKKPRLVLAPWKIGVFVGETIWGLAILGAYGFEAWEHLFPQWFLRLDLADTLGSICAILAAPVAVGGWLFLWGDGPRPFPWVDSLAFNLAFGLCFHGALGALAGMLVARIQRKRPR